ncbi:MAG TPA: ZIP family metal transporter [Gemmatimonadales bacterium]|nr:ZIP family metal transporter [Gemmatimonadales bacterium]
MTMTPLVFAVAAALGNVAGALAVVRGERRSLRFIDACLAFGAGFMLAVATLGVLPQVLGDSPGGAIYVLAGYLAVHLAQHVLTPHFHFGEETHRVSATAGISAMLGLTLHTFFDGVAIASGFLVSGRLGALLFLAVLLHKLPEGVTIASVMVAGGQGRRRALGGAAVLGLATVLGVIFTEQMAPLAQHGLAISGGVTLYVAASNLVPEFQAKRGGLTAAAFFGGALAFFVAERLLEAWIG